MRRPRTSDRVRRRASDGTRRRISSIMLASGAAIALVALMVLVVRNSESGRSSSAPGTGQNLPSPPGQRLADRVDATGRLLVTLDQGLSLVSLPDRGVTNLVRPDPRSSVTSVRWAPDGRSAAYAFYQLRPGEGIPSSDVFVSDLAGEPRLLIGRDRPGTLVEAPTWAPDGSSIYFGYVDVNSQPPVERVERFHLGQGTRTPIADGTLPDVSPDGSLLVLVRSERGDQSLVVLKPDGSEPRTLVPPGRFTLIGGPRFSPDGRTLAVPMSEPPGQAQEPSLDRPFGLLGATVAFAHGNPSEVYLVDLAGGAPRRLTRWAEDEGGLAWSPDGTQLAVYASRGLQLVDLEGRTTYAMERGGYGGVDWAR